MLEFQEELAKKYKYKPLPEELSKEVRLKYLNDLNNTPLRDFINLYKSCSIYFCSKEGTEIAHGWKRIVIGDYGAFLEIDESAMILKNIKIKEGQEYRYEDRYKTCKYYWLTAKDNSDIKIYHQKGLVSYADYKIGFYYISPYEVVI